MRRIWLLALSGAMLLMLSGCTAPPQGVVNLSVEAGRLKDADTAWTKGISGKNLEQVATHYAMDARLAVCGAPALKSRGVIKARYAEWMRDPNFKFEPVTERIDIGKEGDIAFTEGSYQLTLTDTKTQKPSSDQGSFLTVYRKGSDESWKVTSEAFVSEGAAR